MENFFNLGSFVIQAINLAIIVYILKRFIFDPYLLYLEEAERKQREIDEATNTIASIRETAEIEANTLIAEAHKTSFEMREHAKHVAHKNAEDILATAQKESEDLKAKALAEIDQKERAIRSALKQETLKLAINVNKKLLGDEGKAFSGYIEKNLETVNN